MTLGDEAGLLDGSLSRDESATFGGLWIDHDPFSVEVRMTPGNEATPWNYVDDPELTKVIHVEARPVSYADLEKELASVESLLEANKVFNMVEINVRDATVDVMVRPVSDQVVQQLELPANVDITEQDFEIGSASSYGGLNLSNGCTTGFTVHEDSPGTRTGVTTAGHCDNAASLQGVTLTYQAGQVANSTDAQWYTTPGLADLVQFYSGIDTRPVLTVWSRADQAVGDPICKYGRTSGYSCMELWSKSGSADGCLGSAVDELTWMDGCVPAGNHCDLSKDVGPHPGDSGGPVFKNNGARGTTSCGVSINGTSYGLIYMASNFFHAINVHVVSQ